MLRLLQNRLSNKSLFFREIIIFVTFLHFFFIALFYVFEFKSYRSEKFVINSQSKLGSVIVFMPLKKHVDASMNAGSKGNSHQKHQSRKIIDYQSFLKKQRNSGASGKNKQILQKAKKSTVNKTVLKKLKRKPKVVPKKTLGKKIISKKASAKEAMSKKLAQKKVVELKKKVVELKKKSIKEIVKKETFKEEVKRTKPAEVEALENKEIKSETKNTSAKKEEAVEFFVEPIVENVVVEDVQFSEQKGEAIDLADVTFVGYRDLDKLQLQGKVQQAIEVCWSPPLGMPQQTKCELQVMIDEIGQVTEVKVAMSSRVMAFDIAARSAIHKTIFPQDVWGKQIMIELGI